MAQILLILHRRFVTQRRGRALPTVKDLDVFEDRLLRLGARVEIMVMDQFRFQRGD